MTTSTKFARLAVAFCTSWVLGCGPSAFEEDDGDGTPHDGGLEEKAVGPAYQAEDYSYQNGCTRSTARPGYTGTGFMDFGGSSSFVEWKNILAPSSGSYTLTFRYANGGGGDRRGAITVNDTVQVGNVSFGATGSWRTWSTAKLNVVLKQGTNKIRVTANTAAGGPNLDGMDVVSDGGTGAGTSDTDAQLAAFYARYGSRQSFPASYVAILEGVLRAEDELKAKAYGNARSRIDAIFRAYPLTNDIWWSGYGYGKPGAHLGEPPGYYAMRMLDEVASVGVSAPAPSSDPLLMTVVMPACSNITHNGQVTTHWLNQELVANDYSVLRQSLSILQLYVWAISGGTLRLELEFYRQPNCFQVAPPAYVTGAYGTPLNEVPPAIAERTDMWWLIYPGEQTQYGGLFQGGGMGGHAGNSPVFISEDLWPIRKPDSQGGGDRIAVERRLYMPNWLSHEFYHHLFARAPQFGLEQTSHSWFTRSTWPADFVGQWEPDYYAEALHKRFYRTPDLIRTILMNPFVSRLVAADFVGSYQHKPVQNGWHQVSIKLEGGALWWTNAAGARWSLSWRNGELWTGSDCPYGAQRVGIGGRAVDNLGKPVRGVGAVTFEQGRYERQ